LRNDRLIRWLVFNLVGLAGVAVQLGILATLTRVLDLPVALATIVAVEAAVLHNFGWHQRWTWRGRPSTGFRETVRRLVRFHALNGLVSLVGNVAITVAIARTGIDPLAANLVAIVTCSAVNFTTGEWLVFRPSIIILALATILSAAVPAAAQSAAALEGWRAYVAQVDQRHADAEGAEFFALDYRKANNWRARVKAGDVPMIEIEPPGVSDGKLHHWAGAVYVPRTTVDALVKRLQEHAGRESESYEDVTGSRLLERDGDRLRVFLRLRREAGPVTAHYNTEHLVVYRRLGSRATNRSIATRIAELADAGTPQEHEKRPGDDNGFLWRLNAYWRYEQIGDGVLVECESVSLSRSVPFLVRPLVGPIANRIARESLARTLKSLRAFLTGG
jgi:putative flippase GtrA